MSQTFLVSVFEEIKFSSTSLRACVPHMKWRRGDDEETQQQNRNEVFKQLH